MLALRFAEPDEPARGRWTQRDQRSRQPGPKEVTGTEAQLARAEPHGDPLERARGRQHLAAEAPTSQEEAHHRLEPVGTLTAAAVVGGEYFVEPTFSLGAEAQVRYVRQSGDFGSFRDTDTAVLLAARFYLR